MPRSMWKGVISFGIISIPVRLYLATESNGVSFRQLCPEHESPIKYKRWCAEGDHEVAYADVLRGYEVGKDEYVVLDDRDLDNLPLPTAKTIEIQEFVPRDEIDAGLYFKSTYYLEPEAAARKPYFLLRKALEETGRAAVAKIAFRDREHLCSLQPGDEAIVLTTLNWPDEIRSPHELKGLDSADVTLNPREIEMAKTLIESLSDTFTPTRYHDNYREALQQVVEAKVAGREVITGPEAPASTGVVDLMEALKASVEAAKAQRAEKDAATTSKAQARKRKAS